MTTRPEPLTLNIHLPHVETQLAELLKHAVETLKHQEQIMADLTALTAAVADLVGRHRRHRRTRLVEGARHRQPGRAGRGRRDLSSSDRRDPLR